MRSHMNIKTLNYDTLHSVFSSNVYVHIAARLYPRKGY